VEKLHCPQNKTFARHRCWMPKDTLFGHELPMPLADLGLSVFTVVAFLPAVVIVHHTVAFLIRLITKRHKD